MDASQTPNRPPRGPWKPANCDRIALVLQGGGALGAYQAGVYEALHEAGLEPDWVTGVSIGSINAAIIAGNPPERRLERLREFWETVTARRVWMWTPDGDDPRRLRNTFSAFSTMTLGQPGFFTPHLPGPWLSPRGAKAATAFYDNSPLRDTLLKLVDFDLINSGATRFAVGAVNIRSGNFIYFDNADDEIVAEHVMASGALPPALPMVRIGTDCYWDGGIVSNTPLSALLSDIGSDNVMVFQVDLFSARGALPRDMHDVLARQKEIQYSSRTRTITDGWMQLHKQKVLARRLLAMIPEDRLSESDRALKRELDDLPEITILHLIYQHQPYESDARDYEFSATSMREHWAAGYRDTARTLRRREWLAMPGEDEGIRVHDVHHAEETA
ncbi:MAG: patatin-like phospholipase family protein [Rhodospirillales bacterium]|nr:patatin-like phospholipase family protein [Rhodospirillales bacterium]